MAPVSRVQVSLRVFGESLEPDEVSALLGSEPSRSQRKGDDLADGAAASLAETGAWFLDSDLGDDVELEGHVESILSRLTSDPDEWASLTTRYSAELSCGLSLSNDDERLEISPRLAGSLAERGLVIGFDIQSNERTA